MLSCVKGEDIITQAYSGLVSSTVEIRCVQLCQGGRYQCTGLQCSSECYCGDQLF